MLNYMIYLVLPSLVLGSECNIDDSTCAGQDGNLPCPTDCNKYISCSNRNPIIRSCQPSLFYNYITDQCVWPNEIPPDSECLNYVSTTTQSTTTSTPDGKCWQEPCPNNADHGILPYPAHNCSLYLECNLGTTCIKECNEGLIFDPRPDGLSCRVPTELSFRCLDEGIPWFNFDEQHERMERANVITDISNMNRPMCTYNQPCPFEFVPNLKNMTASQSYLESKGANFGGCGNEFQLCFNGWSCDMRCKEGLRFDPMDGNCKDRRILGC